MFRVTVFKFKDLVKYLVGLIVIIGIIAYATRYFSNIKSKTEETSSKIIEQENNNKKSHIVEIKILKKCLNSTIPAVVEINKDENLPDKKYIFNSENFKNSNYLQEFLKIEISSIKGIELLEGKNSNQNSESDNNNSNNITEKINKENDNSNNKNEVVSNLNENEDNSKNNQITLASTNLATEVVTPNPIPENSNNTYGKVKIKNQTTYTLTEDILKPDIKIENKNIIIFHTHSCESYTPSEKYPYTQTGNYRTTDKNFSVIRVGNELENYLKQYKINVVHNTDYHDYPSYTGSYTRSLQTVENTLKTTPSDIIIDLHRDAVGSRPDYAPTVKIGDEYAAQIMFVIGTNDGGLWHPNWQQNLKFAIKVQEKAEEMYPGLFKPIMLTKSRYNQHTGKYANIMEIGSTGNTLDQCLVSMKYLSSVLNEVLK